MKNRTTFRWLALLLAGSIGMAPAQSQKGLKDYYRNYFPIGVAVNPRMVQPGPEAEFIKAQFSSLTPENAMKMGPIHPEEKRYFWKDADAIVDFAQQNNLKVRGHTLCWHNQTPRWFFTDSTGKQVTREVLLARMKQHINDVVGRYKGKIYAWDTFGFTIQTSSNFNAPSVTCRAG